MSNDTARRVAIYARYSSHAQREESIDQQLEVCRAWCAAHGCDVVATYADEHRSGRSTEGRDEFLRMVSDARGGAFDVVLVYKLDRFARDRYDAAIYRKRLRDAGVEVRSAMENIPDGPEGRLLEAVVEGVAEWYSADLSQKTLRGMRHNAERCLANGVQVFGYAIVDGRYEVDPEQAAIVRRVFADWARGVPSAHIARELAAEGVRTARGGVPKKGWPSSVVHDVRYLGTYVWGDVRVEGGMPRIVTDEEWVAAHNRPRRPTMAPTRTHDYPLSGRLVDRATGLPMFGYSAKGRHGRDYAYYGVIEDGHRRLVRRELVEGAVVRAVRSALADAALVEDVVARVMDWQRRSIDSPDVLGARATLRSVAAEEERLLDAIQAGLPLDGIRPRVDALNERKRAARALLERQEGMRVTERDVRAAMSALAAHGTPEAILRRCVAGVVLDRDERAVVVTLPIAKKTSTNRDGVSARGAWQPVPSHVSNLSWQVEGGALLLRAPLAA